jgi:hypothetical protein
MKEAALSAVPFLVGGGYAMKRHTDWPVPLAT